MNEHTKPLILAIDDQPDETLAAFNMARLEDVQVEVVHPQDLTRPMLDAADLVLVDYQIDDWDERNDQPLAMSPPNGLALAVLLREYADSGARRTRGNSDAPRHSAFALHSGHLAAILGRLREQPKPHLIAKLNNLEWAFSKDDPDRFRGMLRLTKAVRKMPDAWPSARASVESALQEMLGLDSTDVSFERCWQDVLASRAPVDELTRDGHSTVPLRWLLHQVLPYPTFLWSECWVAARLSLTIESYREVLSGTSQLRSDLTTMQYSGLLSEFLGPRWWKGAVENYVWELVDGRPSASTLRAAVDERAGTQLEHAIGASTVVCLGSDLKPERIASSEDAIRIMPDHWPSFADSAWIFEDMLRDDPTLISLIDPTELAHFDSGEEEEAE